MKRDSLQRQQANARAEAAKARGRQGEDAAAAHLAAAGLRVVERNWRQGRLELDLVCQEGDTLVFVEVKTRDAHGMATPADALTPRKRSALMRAIQAWLAAHDAWDAPCRIDIVAAYARPGSPVTLEHIRDALEFTPPLGGGDAAWQPW